LNNKALHFIKSFSYTLSSNFINLLISTLVVLIVPKLIGVEEYGYWQLYLFYASYVGFLHFGWNDGIYLRYGGKEYKDLNKNLFFSQFYMQVLLQVIIAVIIVIVSIFTLNNGNRIFIFQMIAINLVLTNLVSMLQFILQATNRFKEYSKITMLGRILYFVLTIVLLISGLRDYKILILADLVGRLISLIYAMYCCKDIVVYKVRSFYFSFKEMIDNINVGIKLMFANIASMLIIGVVRFGIEKNWDVTTFGKVSLTLSISNLMMTFINAVGIIMFPILRRTDESKLSYIYNMMRDFLMTLLLGALIIYYPLKVVISLWLPQYTESLLYMAILFPMFIYEGKMALLINTYMKSMRKERNMLIINLISLIFSILLTIITTILLKSLDLAITSIVITLAFRSVIAELYLSKILKIDMMKEIILELIITMIFILTSWFINSWHVTLIYGVVYFSYLVIKRKSIKYSLNNIKALVKV
jgi:O-antigen/teichoic acid export membrane protein